MWVSNISKSTKAADLKKLFSEKYKVESAKIVTNGKSLFGYICLESLEVAQKMVKDFNGRTLDDRKLSLSLSRPDLRSTSSRVDNKRDKESKPRVSNGVRNTAKKATTTSENGRKGDGKESGKGNYMYIIFG